MTQTMIPSYGRNMNAGELDTKNVLLFNVDSKMCVYIYATKLEQDVEFTQLELNQYGFWYIQMTEINPREWSKRNLRIVIIALLN